MTEQNAQNGKKAPLSAAQAGSKIGALIAPPAADPAAAAADKAAGKAPAKAAAAAPKDKTTKTPPAAAPKGKAKPADNSSEIVDDQAEDTEDGAEDQTDILDDPEEGDDQQADDAQAEDEAGDEAADDTESEGDDEETLHTVVVDGKELQVKYEELVAGYQRQADYTRKAQELAKGRKELEVLQEQVKDLPQAQKAYQEGAQHFVKNASFVLKAFEQGFLPTKPDVELAKTDPAAYLQQKEKYEQAIQFSTKIHQELKAAEETAKADHRKLVAKGRQELYKLYPEMQDAANRQKLRTYAHAHGFTDENIMNEPSPVLFIWADKARKYDEIMASKKALKDTPPKPKVLKQNKSVESHKALETRKRAGYVDQHKKNKSVDSAARAIAGLKLT